jgi:hypothetical protein
MTSKLAPVRSIWIALFIVICSLDWPRDWEIYLAGWVKFTVEKQNCQIFLTKFVWAKTLVMMQQMCCCERFFYQSTQNLNNFWPPRRWPKLAFVSKGERPHSNLHRLHSICFMRYIYRCMNVYLCSLCKLQWDNMINRVMWQWVLKNKDRPIIMSTWTYGFSTIGISWRVLFFCTPHDIPQSGFYIPNLVI